ncbi:MAG: imidazole glycerol phosphate synthase subunit HisH [Oscillospiraceae bacterium]|nr:imidazole glycerol phosphate synthase subunit HisH [Oscillospiraceae bacterium]
MVAIVDYGVGNLFSLKASFGEIGADVTVTSDAEVIKSASHILLPGVGAFSDAAKKLYDSGLWDAVKDEVNRGKPILGICLGMQLLFEKSFEYGEHEGLGLIKGEIRPISEVIPKDLKIPHIGWNALSITRPCDIFKNIKSGDCVYFVHSYYAKTDDAVVATAEYGAALTAAVARGNIYGCQFHPEKSGKTGLAILSAFCETEGI